MKCPFCDTEMLHGYLHCDGLLWSERRHKISTRPDRKEKYALRMGRPFATLHQIESDCCPKCKKLIVDTAYYENNLD